MRLLPRFLAGLPAACVLVGTTAAGAVLAAEADSVTPLDGATGQTLISPQESALAEDVPNGPPNPKPPPYTLLRFTENYAYLADPAKRSDVFDPLKYIPLDDTDPDSYLSFGGELRERYEAYRNQSFGTVPGFHHNDYLLQRLALNADLHVDRRLRFFVQAISGLQDGGFVKPAPDQDPINLQQALVDYTLGNPTLEGDRLTLRAGRFEMTYGSGRLVATRAAPNIPFKFDGVEVIASSGNTAKLYGFLTHPVIESSATFDRSTYRQEFWGVYGTAPLGGRFNAKIDAYYLGYRNDDARFADAQGPERRYTVGSRLSGNLDAWDYDLEGIYQFGTIGPKDIAAWTFSSDAGYSWKAAAWKPRFGAKVDIASGDGRRGDKTVGTFNPLYFKSGYFNDASLFRPSNMIDLHPNLQIQPQSDTTVTLGSDLVWRYSNQDGLYSPSGTMSLPAGGGSHYVGTTAEAALQYRFDRHLTLTASYVHMFTGSYVAAAKGGDVDYFGTWLSYLW